MECDRASPQAAGGEGASARAGTASAPASGPAPGPAAPLLASPSAREAPWQTPQLPLLHSAPREWPQAELRGLRALCWHLPCQVWIPLSAPLPCGQTLPNLFAQAKMPLQPWAFHSPVGSTKGNQTLQSSKDKRSRRPSSAATCPSSPSTLLLLLPPPAKTSRCSQIPSCHDKKRCKNEQLHMCVQGLGANGFG